MESRSGNIPLNRVQMALLSVGFTPTNTNPYGFTGQQIKRLSRQRPYPQTNRRRTPGRELQIVPRYSKSEVDERGEPIQLGFKQIWHPHLHLV